MAEIVNFPGATRVLNVQKDANEFAKLSAMADGIWAAIGGGEFQLVMNSLALVVAQAIYESSTENDGTVDIFSKVVRENILQFVKDGVSR